MPEVDTPAAPGPADLPHHASLDSLRALAVLAVIAYHYDASWAQGGFLGVDLFFVLSGFLITTLLILEWRRSGRIATGALLGPPGPPPPARADARARARHVDHRVRHRPVEARRRSAATGSASLFYVANWRFVAAKQGYFELFSAPSPLRHMWSLAIEEQFYLVWPLVCVRRVARRARLAARCSRSCARRGSPRRSRRWPSCTESGDPSRAYYGTDAPRPHDPHGRVAGHRPRRVEAERGCDDDDSGSHRLPRSSAMLGAWILATATSARYYRGGSAVYAALACIVIAGALQPGFLRRALSLRPLAWIGRISYGLYLFHWPLVVWLVPTRVHLHGFSLNLLRLSLTFAAATLSFYLVELPIRAAAAPRRCRGVGPSDSAASTGAAPRRNVVRWLALPALAATLAVVLASTTGASPAPNYLAGARHPPRVSFSPTFSAKRSIPTPTSTSAPRGVHPDAPDELPLGVRGSALL